SLPARRLGLNDRGIVRPGAWADLAIFDPATFGERGTTLEPNQTATGMQHVLVNGTLTVKDGLLTGARGGQVLRRGRELCIKHSRASSAASTKAVLDAH
ncbi:MAG TPA: hypothetical protein PKE45_10240, partial [Caldilineaceae bacterium]|nr:hypothetical protein [Caldilineaceae bacterium]